MQPEFILIAIFVISLIIFLIYFLINKEKKPFREIENRLDNELVSIINKLRKNSKNKFKLGFWEDAFFIGFIYSILHFLIREYSESNQYHFSEHEENEIIIKTMIKIKGKNYSTFVSKIISENGEDSVEGLLIGKKFIWIIYNDKDPILSENYFMANVMPRYNFLKDKFEEDVNTSYAYKFGKLFSPLNTNNKINNKLEDLEILYKNKTISVEEYKETRISILKKFY